MLQKRFEKVWEAFCEYYRMSRKDYEYYNQPEMRTHSEFHGPHFREERDIVFHLARFCYNEFGDKWVHLDSPIYKRYFDKLDSKKRYVDIDISDPDSFMKKDTKRKIFIEVKWIWRGIYKARSSWLRDIVNNIEEDLKKLQLLYNTGCCEYAFMCIIDEEPEHSQLQGQTSSELAKNYYPVRILVHPYYGQP